MAEKPSTSRVCVHCQKPTETLYKTYSSFIRMTECEQCKRPVDSYVECDNVLVVIDLALQYPSAYRHILYNKGISHFPRLLTILLFCGAYEKWIENRTDQLQIFDLEWRFYLCLIESGLEMLGFVLLALCMEYCMNGSLKRADFVAKSTVAGFYGRVCVVLSIIFRLYSESSYRILMHLFLFLSHYQICRALHRTLTAVVPALFVLTTTLTTHFLAGTIRELLVPL